MGVFFRVGDLVSINRKEGGSFYCKIMNIVDEFGIEHCEYNVIRGNGDKNSKLKVSLSVFAYTKHILNIINITPFIKEETNMHNINIVNIDMSIQDNNTKIELLKKQNDFYNKYRNRQDKIDMILI